MAEFGTSCYGQIQGSRCGREPLWETTQSGGANPINACARHISWLLGMRTVPGASITVTRLEARRG